MESCSIWTTRLFLTISFALMACIHTSANKTVEYFLLFVSLLLVDFLHQLFSTMVLFGDWCKEWAKSTASF